MRNVKKSSILPFKKIVLSVLVVLLGVVAVSAGAYYVQDSNNGNDTSNIGDSSLAKNLDVLFGNEYLEFAYPSSWKVAETDGSFVAKSNNKESKGDSYITVSDDSPTTDVRFQIDRSTVSPVTAADAFRAERQYDTPPSSFEVVESYDDSIGGVKAHSFTVTRNDELFEKTYFFEKGDATYVVYVQYELLGSGDATESLNATTKAAVESILVK